jgi:glucan biosynthesis protein
LSRLDPERSVESNVTVSPGRLLRTDIDRPPGSTNRRLFLDVEFDGRRPADLRAHLTVDGERLSETFTLVLRP